ncbi:MAG: hypothetical protein KIT84_43720 [Labilithrix sp.]|nr:hypothetical protein [Labilithrix sp.]MCW5817989.1 hypothetical protein [Labilithrix sp.]
MGNPYRDAAPPERRVWFLPDTKRDRLILLTLAGLFVAGTVVQFFRAHDPPARTITNEEILAVVAHHRVDLRERCFVQRREIAIANVTIAVTVDASGGVLDQSAKSEYPALNRCVESEVKRWRFPARPFARDEDLNIPIVFERS